MSMRKTILELEYLKSTVKPCFTDTRLIINAESSLLRTVCFVPGERKPLHFLYIHPEVILRSLFCFKDTKIEVY